MSDRKVIVAGWITVDPKKRDEAVDSFKDLVLRARNAPGCLDLAITADPVDPSRINNFEFWQSQKDLDAWPIFDSWEAGVGKNINKFSGCF